MNDDNLVVSIEIMFYSMTSMVTIFIVSGALPDLCVNDVFFRFNLFV